MGTPNFSNDKHLTTTYAIEEGDSFDFDDEYVLKLADALGKVNSRLSNGALSMRHGSHEGVSIGSKLYLGGNYENSGSVDDSLEAMTRILVDLTDDAVSRVKDKYCEEEVDSKVFITDVANRMVEVVADVTQIKTPEAAQIVDLIIERNKTLDYDMDDEEQLGDLVTHVLDYEYWHKQATAGFDDIIAEMDAGAKEVAIACGMSVLSVDKGGYGCSLSPITSDE